MSLLPGLARKRTLVLLNIASVVERADEQVPSQTYSRTACLVDAPCTSPVYLKSGWSGP